MNHRAVLSPYLVPPSLPGKKVNLGDGFILRAIERRIGPFEAPKILSSREKPSRDGMARLKEAGTVILGGANQLSDTFTVWPGATAADIRESGLAFVPFGVGLNGEPDKNTGFSEGTLAVLDAIHERIEYSSWRCPNTVALLERALPDLKGRMLMTGCPVIFDRPLLEEARFADRRETIAVTVTERGDFWQRESTLLRTVARLFPQARKTLVLHQQFEEPGVFETRFGTAPFASLVLSKRARLRVLARRLGYAIAAPESADGCIAFYDVVDMHLGSRLHAHLLFLSRNKPSFLVPVDGRSAGFADMLGFPLVAPGDIEAALGFDFEIVRERARTVFATMEVFVDSLQRHDGGRA